MLGIIDISNKYVWMMFLFYFMSLAVLIWLSYEYQQMIRQAEKMSITNRKELKSIKTKFLNSYGKYDGEEINTNVFVEKAVEKIKIHGLRPSKWKYISLQLLIVSIVFAGYCVFHAMTEEKTIREILPIYLFVFLELYVYFSVDGICELEQKRKLLKLNILEYIDNHMIHRINISKAFQEEELNIKEQKEIKKKQEMFSEEESEELESLLQEFLV